MSIRTHKHPVVASRAVVTANHPEASAAGLEILAMGGNAVDAAVATLFSLSVVEPMMVGPCGAGFFVIRDGRTGEVRTLDNYATVGGRAPQAGEKIVRADYGDTLERMGKHGAAELVSGETAVAMVADMEVNGGL